MEKQQGVFAQVVSEALKGLGCFGILASPSAAFLLLKA